MIIIDTSVIVAYYNSRDSCHDRALGLLKDIDQQKYGTPLITDYVFDEAVTVCLARAGKTAAIELGTALMRSFTIVRISTPLFKVSWKLFQETGRLSFTDCATIAVARELSIAYIATFDQEFERVRNVQIVG